MSSKKHLNNIKLLTFIKSFNLQTKNLRKLKPNSMNLRMLELVYFDFIKDLKNRIFLFAG